MPRWSVFSVRDGTDGVHRAGADDDEASNDGASNDKGRPTSGRPLLILRPTEAGAGPYLVAAVADFMLSSTSFWLFCR